MGGAAAMGRAGRHSELPTGVKGELSSKGFGRISQGISVVGRIGGGWGGGWGGFTIRGESVPLETMVLNWVEVMWCRGSLQILGSGIAKMLKKTKKVQR